MADVPITHATCDVMAGMYEMLVDWSRRLANEGPFFEALFAAHRVHRVLDVACGTGHHAALFCSWGMDVEAADSSAAMLARARALHGESDRLRWVERPYQRPAEPPGRLDSVLCIGNSLSLAPTDDEARLAIRAMVSALRPGGVGVIQVLNIWRLAEGPTLWQKCRLATCDGRDRIVLKGVHRAGSHGYIDLVDLTIENHRLDNRFDSTTLLGFEAYDLGEWLRDFGATVVKTLGSYRGEPFDRQASEDLVVVFQKAGG